MSTLASLVLAAALGQTRTMPQITEMMVPDSGRVTVCVAVPAPEEMGGRNRTAWRLIGETLMEGSGAYSRRVIFAYGSQAGVAPRVQVFSDWILIQVSAPKGGTDIAAQIAAGMATDARLSTLDVEKAVQRRKTEGNPWVLWGDAQEPEMTRVDNAYIKRVYQAAFRVERMHVVVMGDVAAGEGEREVVKYFRDRLTDPPTMPRDVNARPIKGVPGRVDFWEWQAPLLKPGAPDFAPRILALYALGVGKDGAMTRVLREKLGYTYRQQLVLWPQREGWLPRFVAQRAGSTDAAAELNASWEAMRADIDTWDKMTLDRARMLVLGSLDTGLPMDPFWIGPDWRLGESLEDRAAFAVHGSMSGKVIDPEQFASDSLKVDLDILKATAREIVDASSSGVYPGLEASR